MDDVLVQSCDSCPAEWWGASVGDILAQGWKRANIYKGGVFTMCPECVARYRPIWAERDAARRAAA